MQELVLRISQQAGEEGTEKKLLEYKILHLSHMSYQETGRDEWKVWKRLKGEHTDGLNKGWSKEIKETHEENKE